METKGLNAIGTGHKLDINSIDISSDGMYHYIASVSDDATARVWDMHGYEVGKYLTTTALCSVEFFPDSHYLALGSSDSSVRIVNWRSGSLVKVLPGHTGHCYAVNILPMSRKIVSASADNSLIVWSKQRPAEDFSPRTEFGYSIEKILAGHQVCVEACPVIQANNVRVLFCQSRRQTTKGG